MKKKWNKETCYQEAKKYKTRNEFQKGSASAYHVARRNKWLDDYTWFERLCKPNGYWNYETCYEEARKYNTKTEFRNGCGGAYNVAKKHKWLNKYEWMVDGKAKLFKDKIDSVYVYLFEDNTVYVGRTLMKRQNERHNQHTKDKVGNYAKIHNIQIPQMQIIEDNLTLLDWLRKRDFKGIQYDHNFDLI